MRVFILYNHIKQICHFSRFYNALCLFITPMSFIVFIYLKLVVCLTTIDVPYATFVLLFYFTLSSKYDFRINAGLLFTIVTLLKLTEPVMKSL